MKLKIAKLEETALRDLGSAYLRLDNYAKGIEYFEQLLAITREIKDRPGEETALRNLMNAYRDLDNYDKVIEYPAAVISVCPRKYKTAKLREVFGGVGICLPSPRQLHQSH